MIFGFVAGSSSSIDRSSSIDIFFSKSPTSSSDTRSTKSILGGTQDSGNTDYRDIGAEKVASVSLDEKSDMTKDIVSSTCNE